MSRLRRRGIAFALVGDDDVSVSPWSRLKPGEQRALRLGRVELVKLLRAEHRQAEPEPEPAPTPAPEPPPAKPGARGALVDDAPALFEPRVSTRGPDGRLQWRSLTAEEAQERARMQERMLDGIARAAEGVLPASWDSLNVSGAVRNLVRPRGR